MNRSIDSRSDLYSAGVTLYEMATGALPFQASDPIEWFHSHFARRPAPADSRNRVRSMALVHENLYRAGDFSRIAMASHITALCAQLVRAYRVPDQQVELVVHAGELQLDMGRAATCGLIINELVSNALEHAFPHGRCGKIRVGVATHDGRQRLWVSDNGVGLPAGLDLGQTDSLGLQLVRDLAEQLRGTLSVTREGGTTFTIEFDDAAGRA